MRLGLGWRLTIIFLTITFLVVGVASYLFFDTFRHRLLDERSVALLTQSNMVASGVAPTLQTNLAETEVLLRARSRESGVRLLLLDTDGRVVIDASAGAVDDPLRGQRLNHPLVDAALGGAQETSVHYLGEGDWVMYAAVPVVRHGEVIGVLFTSESINDIAGALLDLARQLLAYLGASGVIVALITVGLGQRLTAPLRQLTGAAERLGEGNLAERVEIRRSDELGRLGEAFNRMAQQLEQVDRSRRRFIGDASHEMRTPLGSIKILVESLLAQEGYDPGETRELLGDIDTSVDRLARLVESLLVLTRLEHARAVKDAARWEPINLSELAHQVAGDFARHAGEKAIRLDVEGPENIWVLGDEDALYRAVRNLMENAVRYTGHGGAVTMQARRNDTQVLLRVRDTGVGIAPKDLPHIFERFYRPDDARSRQVGGFGLGLAIVRETVELHGGSVQVTSRPGQGTTFAMRLPAHERGADSEV